MRSRKLALLGSVAALGAIAAPVASAAAATPHHAKAKVVHTERSKADHSKDRTNNERKSADHNKADRNSTDKSGSTLDRSGR